MTGIETGNFDSIGFTERQLLEVSLLKSLADTAEKFTSGKGWSEGINSLLSDLGHLTGVNRVWIFQVLEVTDDSITQDYTFEWVSDPGYAQIGVSFFNKFTNSLADEGYRKLIESRKRGEWQKVLTFRMEDGWLRKKLLEQDIKSMLTIPIMVEKELWGVLGFDDCEREYDWSDTEIALLRIAAFFISSSVFQNRLRAREKQFEILQQIISTGAWEYDVKSRHIWSSIEKFSTFGMSGEELHLSLFDFLKLVHKQDRRGLFERANAFFSGSRDIANYDLRIRDKNGAYHWVEMIGALGRDSAGEVVKMSGIIIDIGERKQAEVALKKEAETDILTGAKNRRLFEYFIQEQMKIAAVKGKTFSLLLFDIDHFKSINDQWGHSVGDEVLKHFTRISMKNLREGDSFFRIGGEEFALLLSGASAESSRSAAERIRKSVEETPASTAVGSVPFTVSAGFALCRGRSRIRTLFDMADRALYKAKKDGRNRVIGYCEL